MAISSSGSVSFSQIQSEFGGSNPISLSEYYSGGLPNNFNNTGTSTAFAPTVKSTTTTYSYTSGKATLTATRYYDGFCNTALNSYMTNTTQSMVINKFTGVDKTGNAGAIPSSGAIQANHFRGTNGTGTSNSIVCLGVVNYRDTGGTFQNVGYVFFQGHIGTAFNPYGGGTIGATGGPFVRVVTSAKGNYGSTSIYQNTTTNTSNGWFNGKFAVFHTSNSTVGNYTTMSFFSSATQSMGGLSGTWSQTFYLS